MLLLWRNEFPPNSFISEIQLTEMDENSLKIKKYRNTWWVMLLLWRNEFPPTPRLPPCSVGDLQPLVLTVPLILSCRIDIKQKILFCHLQWFKTRFPKCITYIELISNTKFPLSAKKIKFSSLIFLYCCSSAFVPMPFTLSLLEAKGQSYVICCKHMIFLCLECGCSESTSHSH